MFERCQIERAVDLQARSYQLLLWVEKAMEDGFISFDAAHHYSTFPAAAKSWIAKHYDNIPPRARPEREDLEPFANLFSTYIESSFDLERDPGRRLYSPDAHCFCPMCSWLVDLKGYQPKKLGRADKNRARKLRRDSVERVAIHSNIEIDGAQLDALADDRSLTEATSLVAYAEQLLHRLEGRSDGPAVLALWRGFAWKPEGSPKKGFVLRAEHILEAVNQIADRLAEAA